MPNGERQLRRRKYLCLMENANMERSEMSNENGDAAIEGSEEHKKQTTLKSISITTSCSCLFLS